MKLSVFYNHILQAATQSGKTLDEVVKMAADCGIGGVDTHVELIDRDPEMMPRLNKYGIILNCPYEFFNWNSVEYGDMTRLHHLVDSAAKYGANKVLVVPGFLEGEVSERLNDILDRTEITADGYLSPEFDSFMRECEDMVKIADMMRRAVAYGKERGVTIMVEDFDNMSSPVARTLTIMWFLKNVDGLKFAFDSGNFASADEDSFLAAELLKDYINHVHLKDRGEQEGFEGKKHSRGLATVAVGSGYLPICEMVEWVRGIGYDGYFALEHFEHPDQCSAIPASAEFVKSI